MEDNPILQSVYRVSPQSKSTTDYFYSWDYRLRGYELYEYPIHPEPVFIPFYNRHITSAPLLDDGRRHTLFSGLIASLKDSLRAKTKSPLVESPAEENYEPVLYVPDGEWVEFQVALPADTDYHPNQIISFLQGLRGLRHPLTFELIGTGTHILTQFSVVAADRTLFESQFAAFFPKAVVTTQPDSLLQAWFGSHSRAVSVVDFGLAEECGLAIENYERNFAPDPYISLIAALETVSKRECAVFQVIFVPARNDWNSELVKAITDDDGSCIFVDAPELKRATAEKARSPLFASVIRVGCVSETDESAKLLMQRVGSALGQFDAPGRNRLIPLSNEYFPDQVHEDDLLFRITHRTGMILSAPELVGVMHLPTSQIVSPKLLRDAGRTKSCPHQVLGHQLTLGTNPHHGVERTVSLSTEQRVRHLYIIGASGTGKSTLLLNLITQDMEQGEGLALLDPHGDLTDDVLKRVPEARKRDVIIFDPGDEEFPIGFNIFHAHSEAEKTLLASDLTTTFQRLSTSWGDRMHAILANGIMAMLDHPDGGTLLTLRRFLTDKSFRQSYLLKITDPEIKYYWEKEYPLHGGKPEGPVLTRIDTFLRPKTIRNMVAQTKSAIDFTKVMNERKILLVKLSHGAIGEENAHLLGTLIVTAIHQAALRRQSTKSDERTPFYLYADEFQNFVTPSMESILSGARKYHLGLILAHQERRQLLSKDREVASSVLTNPYTRICFRLGYDDASSLAKGLSFFDSNDLQNLGIGQAIVRAEQAQYDFNLTVPWDQHDVENKRIVDEITELSRKTYGRPRVEVEATVRSFYADYESRVSESDKDKHKVQDQRKLKQPESKIVSLPKILDIQQQAEPKSIVRPKTPGRGGTQHSYLQNLIKKYAEELGFSANIEKEVLGGKGFVDVSLTLGEKKIGCEISVSTAIEYEIQNIHKCLAAGYDFVVMVCGQKKRLHNLQTAIYEGIDADLLEKVKLLDPELFLQFLYQLIKKPKEEVKSTRGYRVSTSFLPLSQNDCETKNQAVSKLIASTLNKK